MTPVVCRVKHDPPNSYGDCIRACIATMFDLDAEAVPHFMESGDPTVCRDALADWLFERGFAPVFSHYDGQLSREDVLSFMGSVNPSATYLLHGMTASGEGHVVVCQGSEVVHDPAWVRSGLVRGQANGFWSVMVAAKR